MVRVFKYPLERTLERQQVVMPLDAVIIDAQLQDGTLCLWAIVDEEAVSFTRQFVIAATGGTLPDCELKHISTIQRNDYVGHVFEVLPAAGSDGL